MATNPCTGGRRLSDLLQEQQEPFLLLQLQDHSATNCAGGATPSTASTLGRRTIVLSLRGGTCTARKLPLPLRWVADLAGCFPFPCQRSFRRLPRAEDGDDVADCGRQVSSPVSALDLDLHSDAESPVLVLSSQGDEHDNNDDDGKPSKTSSGTGTSAPPSHAMGRFQRKSGDCSLSLLVDREPEAVVSAWETIAADISRIPNLVQLDMSSAGRSLRDDWTRLAVAGEEEEDDEEKQQQQPRRQVGRSIEAMIFEDVKWDAVRDMLDLPLPATACHTTSLTNS